MTRFSSISFAIALASLALPNEAFSQAAAGVQGASGVGLPDSRAVKLAQLYNGGMQFFEGQKYQEAITRLEDLEEAAGLSGAGGVLLWARRGCEFHEGD
jgi:hypothetical protein